jgi:hypothetical protein
MCNIVKHVMGGRNSTMHQLSHSIADEITHIIVSTMFSSFAVVFITILFPSCQRLKITVAYTCECWRLLYAHIAVHNQYMAYCKVISQAILAGTGAYTQTQSALCTPSILSLALVYQLVNFTALTADGPSRVIY